MSGGEKIIRGLEEALEYAKSTNDRVNAMVPDTPKLSRESNLPCPSDSGKVEAENRELRRLIMLGDFSSLRPNSDAAKLVKKLRKAALASHPTPLVEIHDGVIADRAACDHPVREGWQPIETAPKDRTPVLVVDEGIVSEAYYHDEREGWWLAQTDPTDYTDGQVYPAHWMPLPEAPTTGSLIAPEPAEQKLSTESSFLNTRSPAGEHFSDDEMELMNDALAQLRQGGEKNKRRANLLELAITRARFRTSSPEGAAANELADFIEMSDHLRAFYLTLDDVMAEQIITDDQRSAIVKALRTRSPEGIESCQVEELANHLTVAAFLADIHNLDTGHIEMDKLRADFVRLISAALPTAALSSSGGEALLGVEDALRGDERADADTRSAASMFMFWPCNNIDLTKNEKDWPRFIDNLAVFLAKRDRRAAQMGPDTLPAIEGGERDTGLGAPLESARKEAE